MVPAITAGGRSFRGAALYYLHDKREDGEAVRLTADRVAWIETVNLPTGDPERAWRIIAHTALAQGHLKAAAGMKATGRQVRWFEIHIYRLVDAKIVEHWVELSTLELVEQIRAPGAG